MVVAVPKKRSRKIAQSYKDHMSSDNSDYDEIEESDYESEEERPSKKRTQARPSARARKTPTASNDEENSLFKALSSPVVAVSELALEWVESYLADQENNKADSLVELFNLLLRAVGCKVPVQSHDLLNADSAVATVTELNIHFEKQKYHENPFASPNKEVRHFRKNVLELFEEIIFYAHEKGCLYKDHLEEGETVLASEMMTYIISWLSALSASRIRPFRLVATSVILAVQTQLCHQAATLDVSIERQSRQLSNAQNSTKSKRKPKSHEEKISVITKNLESTQLKKDTIDEYLDDITKEVFVHRYRDLDSAIRVECLRALGDWMMANPAHFLSSSYLRYYGWLLSDPTDSVREEVVKVLHKLFKSLKGSIENMAFSFRKFTKRFQQQLINMIWKESVPNIQVNLFGIYHELLKIGYLQSSDKIRICSFVFYLAESEMRSGTSNAKLRAETSRVITAMCAEEIGSLAEQPHSTEERMKLSSFIKLKSFCTLLQNALEEYKIARSQLLPNDDEFSSWKATRGIFHSVYSLEQWSGSWESIVQYLSLDTSRSEESTDKSGEGMNNDVLKSIELTTQDQYYLLCCLAGSIQFSLEQKPRKGTASTDAPSTLMPKLSCHLEDLESLSSKVPSAYPIFMNILNQILSFPTESIREIYEHSNNVEGYNRLHGKILQYFMESQEVDFELLEAYKSYFDCLLSSSNDQMSSSEESNRVINPNIYLKIEDLILALSTEVQESLINSKSSFDAFHDATEQDDPFSDDQKDLCNTLIEVVCPLSKLTILGDVTNIIRFVGEPLEGSSLSVLEQISRSLLSKFSFQTLVESWPRNLLKVIPHVSRAWEALLDFGLVCLCWKLEDLMYSMNDGTAETINVDVYLDDVCNIFLNSVEVFISLNDVVIELNEKPLADEASKPLKSKLADIMLLFGTKVIDYATSLKFFYDHSRLSNSFRDYDAMFRDSTKLGDYVTKSLPENFQDAIMNAFYVREARLAKTLSVTLEKSENESVNLEELFMEQNNQVEIPHQDFVTNFDSSDDEVDDEVSSMRQTAENEARANAKISMEKNLLEQQTWTHEKDLSVYSVKLVGLIKSKALTAERVSRFALNREKLGQTFKSIASLVDEDVHTLQNSVPEIQQASHTIEEVAVENS